jgi:DNA polymerase
MSTHQDLNLESIANQIRHCSQCNLYQERKNAVPGEGNPHTTLLFIGEGPGKTEDEQGTPFCGASGKFLNELLQSIQFTRQSIFITNIVKCRPPNNRDPLPEEIITCTNLYLEQQIKLIQPKLIITLGRHALNYFIPNLKISVAHGKIHRHNQQYYLPLYHPAVALYNGSMREVLKTDFLIIPRALKKIEILQTTN